MKNSKRILGVLLLLVFSVFVGKTVNAATLDNEKLEKSKSKTATALDENYESRITISLPSKEEELVSDVVFVLDYSSCSEETAAAMIEMLSELNNSIKTTNASIKVGVIIFRGYAVKAFDLATYNDEAIEELRENVSKIPEELQLKSGKGSNLPAGILAAKQMLLADTSVANNRKYAIVISDGATYLFTKNNEYNKGYTRITGNGGGGSLYEWDEKYNPITSTGERKYPSLTNGIPENWDSFLSNIEKNNAEYEKYDKVYYRDNMDCVNNLVPLDGIITNEVSFMQSAKFYHDLENAGINTYFIQSNVAGEGDKKYEVIDSFVKYLQKNKSVDFKVIQKDIKYLVDSGSKVVDYIGKGKDNFGSDYDFEVVDGTFTLTINGEALNLIKVDTKDNATSTYAVFNANNEVIYLVNYYAGENERVELEIYVPISNFARVELSFTEKLINPDTKNAGKHEVDTNEDATITIISTDQSTKEEKFEKPKVNYTIGKVIAHYVDSEGKVLGEDIITTQRVGKTYNTEKLSFEGYEFLNVIGEESGKYIDGTIEVTYVYTNAIGDIDVPDEEPIEPPHTDAEVTTSNIIMYFEEDKKRR